MKNILLTGARGMIGSHLSKYLTENGYNVIPFEGDVCDWNNWKVYQQIDCLIHLAALAGVRDSIGGPERFYNINVEGMSNAVRYVKSTQCIFLYASSSNAKQWWTSPYSTTKRMNEIQAQALNQSIGMRFHTVWPGREDMLYGMLQQKTAKYVEANQYRDFIHIDDLCAAILTIMQNYSMIDPVVDIGTGHMTPLLELATKFGFDGEIRYTSTPNDSILARADVEYLLALGWTPTRNILI